MFDFSKVELTISKDDILQKISSFDIFKYYCTPFVEINKSFCSELRFDKNPDCRIYVSGNNDLKYHDFATGENYDCWNYVMRKYNCNYYEALTIIATDFKIIQKNNITLNPKIITANDNIPIIHSVSTSYKKEKSRIEIISQPFNSVDANYWNQYEISLEKLEEFNVYSAKYVYIYKGDKRYIIEYKKNNPIYAYRFERENQYSYKIYRPKEDKKNKWLFSGGSSEDVEGYDQLPLSGDLLIITKSLKDVMCYNILGYSAISLQGEANKLNKEFLDKLYKRFYSIVVQYDNDEQGIKSSNKLHIDYKLPILYIPPETNCKDLSDYIKENGLENAKTLVNNLLNEIK